MGKRLWVSGRTLKELLRKYQRDRAVLAPLCGDEIPTHRGRVWRIDGRTSSQGAEVYQALDGAAKIWKIDARPAPQDEDEEWYRIERKWRPTILPLWDVGQQGNIANGEFGGIYNDPLINPFLGIDDYQWITTVEAGWGLYLRVRAWRLFGEVTLSSSSGVFAGTIDLVMNAVKYGTSTAIIREEDICCHGGWYGTDTTQPGWTFTAEGEPPEEYDPGAITITLWPRIRADGDVIGQGFVFGRPQMIFLSGLTGYGGGIAFGQTNDSDACLVTGEVPITHDASFDGTGLTEFALKLGGPAPDVGMPELVVSGAVTLAPASYWPYNPGDGGGPIFSADNGTWLRTPPGF